MFDMANMLGLAGISLSLVGMYVAGIRYVANRSEELRREMQGAVEMARKEGTAQYELVIVRLDRVPADYVRKDDLLQHLTRVEHAVEKISSRLDGFVSQVLDALQDSQRRGE